VRKIIAARACQRNKAEYVNDKSHFRQNGQPPKPTGRLQDVALQSYPVSTCGSCRSGQWSCVLSKKITVADIRAMKGRAGIAALTAYDYPLAKLLDEAEIPFIHVGDSVGMVVLGYPDTTHVTVDDIEHHVRAVARATPKGLITADLPYRSYDTPASALANARRLMAAGAESVKAEGGREILPQVQALVSAGIPYCGHLGMLPQKVKEEGGYRVKGRTESQREALLADAKALADTGAFAIVLELVTPDVAREITLQVPVPTIGIGSGPGCDGQILVTQDLVGLFPWFTPRFVTPRIASADQIRSVVRGWKDEIQAQHEGA
jgi:3-methyl-2-oxobutanoate hydroxymethyltransferase